MTTDVEDFGDYLLIQFAGGGPLGARAFMGTEWANGERAHTFDERVRRCYEIAGYAIAFGSAGDSARLVHGSWHGPNADQRIGHAWVELPNGLLWEPIHAAIFDAEAMKAYARMWDERTYDKSTARKMIQSHQDYGRWHESRYP